MCHECSVDADCPTASLPHCSPFTNLCSNCISDSDCARFYTDQAGYCDSATGTCYECGSTEYCSLKTATPICSSTKTCTACTSSTQCPDISLAKCSAGACTVCTANADCTHFGSSYPLCSSGTCHECITSADCSQTTKARCDTGQTPHICVSCSLNTDCEHLFTPSASGYCEPTAQGNVCRECNSDAACKQDVHQCKKSNKTCKTCDTNGDCTSLALSKCHLYTKECVACTEKADCVHLFTNAQGFCSAGSCKECNIDSHCLDPSKPVCINNACKECADASWCNDSAKPVCSPTTHTCVGCAKDSDCLNKRTDVVGWCDKGTGKCQDCDEDIDCLGSLEFCKLSSHSCVECLTNDHCPELNNAICDLGTNSCRPCTSHSLPYFSDYPRLSDDNYCGRFFKNALGFCEQGTCTQCFNQKECLVFQTCLTDSFSCLDCNSNLNCKDPGASRCDVGVTYNCLPCSEDTDCGHVFSDSNGWCDRNLCRECHSDAHCQKNPIYPHCNTRTNVCEECTRDEHCLDPKKSICVDLKCVECSGNLECRKYYPFSIGWCNALEGGICYECNSHVDCALNDVRKFCNLATHACVECIGHENCLDHRLAQCSSLSFNECVSCTADVQCEHLYFWSTGTCAMGVCRECILDSHCFGDNTFCRMPEMVCSNCLTTDDCLDPLYPRCDGNYECGPCKSDEDCRHLYSFSDFSYEGYCLQGVCVECGLDRNCQGSANGKLHCQPLTNTCEECANDEQCLDLNLGRCDVGGTNTCVPCQNRENCDHFFTDIDTYKGFCRKRDGRCTECRSYSDCLGEKKIFCDQVYDNQCTKCITYLNCPDIKIPYCEQVNYTCVPCQSDIHCDRFFSDSTGYCNAGICFPCSENENCITFKKSYCDKGDFKCKDCLVDSHCTHLFEYGGLCYKQDNCFQCWLDKDCKSGSYCIENKKHIQYCKECRYPLKLNLKLSQRNVELNVLHFHTTPEFILTISSDCDTKGSKFIDLTEIQTERVGYKWELISKEGDTAYSDYGSSGNSTLYFLPFHFMPGFTYNFTFYVLWDYGPKNVSANYTISVIKLPLIANFTYELKNRGSIFALNGSASRNPNFESGNDPNMKYKWSCIEYPPVFKDINGKPNVEFSAEQLPRNGTYTLMLVVVSEDFEPGVCSIIAKIYLNNGLMTVSIQKESEQVFIRYGDKISLWASVEKGQIYTYLMNYWKVFRYPYKETDTPLISFNDTMELFVLDSAFIPLDISIKTIVVKLETHTESKVGYNEITTAIYFPTVNVEIEGDCIGLTPSQFTLIDMDNMLTSDYTIEYSFKEPNAVNFFFMSKVENSLQVELLLPIGRYILKFRITNQYQIVSSITKQIDCSASPNSNLFVEIGKLVDNFEGNSSTEEVFYNMALTLETINFQKLFMHDPIVKIGQKMKELDWTSFDTSQEYQLTYLANRLTKFLTMAEIATPAQVNLFLSKILTNSSSNDELTMALEMTTTFYANPDTTIDESMKLTNYESPSINQLYEKLNNSVLANDPTPVVLESPEITMALQNLNLKGILKNGYSAPKQNVSKTAMNVSLEYLQKLQGLAGEENVEIKFREERLNFSSNGSEEVFSAATSIDIYPSLGEMDSNFMSVSFSLNQTAISFLNESETYEIQCLSKSKENPDEWSSYGCQPSSLLTNGSIKDLAAIESFECQCNHTTKYTTVVRKQILDTLAKSNAKNIGNLEPEILINFEYEKLIVVYLFPLIGIATFVLMSWGFSKDKRMAFKVDADFSKDFQVPKTRKQGGQNIFQEAEKEIEMKKKGKKIKKNNNLKDIKQRDLSRFKQPRLNRNEHPELERIYNERRSLFNKIFTAFIVPLFPSLLIWLLLLVFLSSTTHSFRFS